MISTRVMNEMEYVKKVKLLMMLGQEAANVSLVGLVHSAMKTKTNVKLVLMRLVFNLTLEFLSATQLQNKCKHRIENLLKCDPAHGICVNEYGSYKCKCKEGFILDTTNSKTCTDIDECHVGNGGCADEPEGGCLNTEGSYQCYCNDGYKLDIMGKRKCWDMDECAKVNFKITYTKIRIFEIINFWK